MKRDFFITYSKRLIHIIYHKEKNCKICTNIKIRIYRMKRDWFMIFKTFDTFIFIRGTHVYLSTINPTRRRKIGLRRSTYVTQFAYILKKKKRRRRRREERKSCSKECAHDIQTDMKGLFYGVHEREK